MFAQKKVEILNAKTFKFEEVNGHKARRLIGDVKLKQDDVLMYCDSANFYAETNGIDAFGHIHIKEGDSLDIYSDKLNYDGKNKKAILTGNVRLLRSDMQLTSNELHYDTKNKVASYYSGGKITGKKINLTSKRGYYYETSQMSFFRGDVVFVNESTRITADTLSYDMNRDITYFYTDTKIENEKDLIYCNKGYYSAKTEISEFSNYAIIYSEKQQISADSIWYDQRKGIGKAYNNAQLVDTASNIIICGNKAEYSNDPEKITVTDQAYCIYLMEKDSFYISGDTLKAYPDSSGANILRAWHHVLMYKDDLQGICDSLVYSESDSLVRLYYNPIVWSGENQMKADTIYLELKNDELHKVYLHKSAFLSSRSHTDMFNQIKGKNVLGYFSKGDLEKMLVEGNGESIYYAKNDSDEYIGVNKAVCSNMWLYFKENEVQKITFLTKPDASFLPIADINPKDLVLKDFVWLDHLRPKSKEEVIAPAFRQSFLNVKLKHNEIIKK